MSSYILLLLTQKIIYLLSIYIYKEESLFVCSLCIGPCNSYDHQICHDTPLGPEERRERVGAIQEGWEGGGAWVKFTQF